MQESQCISNCIRGIVADGAAIGNVPAQEEVAFENLTDADREDMADIVKARLKSLDPAQAAIFRLKDDDVASWLDGVAPCP